MILRSDLRLLNEKLELIVIEMCETLDKLEQLRERAMEVQDTLDELLEEEAVI